MTLMKGRPNMLFFFAYDLRFDTLGAAGAGEVEMLKFDRLATAGTSFTHASIPGGSCGATCTPGRSMSHSGRTMFRLDQSRGAWGDRELEWGREFCPGW